MTDDRIRPVPRYTLLRERWLPDLSRGGPRRARVPVPVEAYVPAPLIDLDLRVSVAAVTAISDAEGAIAASQAHADHVGVSTIAVQLLRSEAIASSQLAGVSTPSHRALAKALVRSRDTEVPLTGPAAATIANVEAVRAAYARAASADGPLTTKDLCGTHAAIAQSDRHMARFAGEIRTAQNWIGRDPYTPASADFVPPPARMVPELLDDLCVFCSRRDISPLLQAAIAHAQFETIHPFADGNGRVGRALIGELICRGGLARDVIPPTSLVLSGRRAAYVDALTAWRFEDDGRDRWVRELAEAAHTAADGSIRLADEIAALKVTWRERCARRRADSAAVALLDHLPSHPILTGADAMRLTGRSGPAARAALNDLTEDGVLAEVTLAKRNRAWESIGLFALVDQLGHDLSGGAISGAETR
jgi:Fic family protein